MRHRLAGDVLAFLFVAMLLMSKVFFWIAKRMLKYL